MAAGHVRGIVTLEAQIAGSPGTAVNGASLDLGDQTGLAQHFLGTLPVCLVGPRGQGVPGGSGAKLIILDVLQGSFVRSGPGGIGLGAVE